VAEERFLPTRLTLDPTAYVAPTAVLVGEVSLAAGASVWFGSVLRGDLEPVRVGRSTNVQDGVVIHVDRGYPATIGERVTLGHRAVIHGCTVEDDALVGMGAVVLSGARIGAGALVAAGALVREGFDVPPGTIAAGVPARVVGPVTDELRERIAAGVRTYEAAARGYRTGELGGGPHGGGR
jgi:carbonic anhydrase/acetyltransferase-like protein (isoleucine patch superfamily)